MQPESLRTFSSLIIVLVDREIKWVQDLLWSLHVNENYFAPFPRYSTLLPLPFINFANKAWVWRQFSFSGIIPGDQAGLDRPTETLWSRVTVCLNTSKKHAVFWLWAWVFLQLFVNKVITCEICKMPPLAAVPKKREKKIALVYNFLTCRLLPSFPSKKKVPCLPHAEIRYFKFKLMMV